MSTHKNSSSSAELVRRIDTSLLSSLHALLVTGSVSKAAFKTGQSQPAMSRHLAALREITGDPLLVRDGNAMILTDRAVSLQAPVRRILNDLSMLVASASSFEPAAASYSFRLALYDFLPAAFYAELAHRLTRESPGSTLSIQCVGERTELLRQLAEGEIDLAITSRHDLPGFLRAASLYSEPMVCVVRPGHPLQIDTSVERYRLAGHVSSLEQSPGAGGALDELLARIGVELRVVVRTQYLSLVPPMLAATDLVFTTGRMLGRAMAEQHGLVVLPVPVAASAVACSLVWHERLHRHKAVTWMRALIRRAIRETLD
jgi:DNA-binding transcriptional LysR family regulator